MTDVQTWLTLVFDALEESEDVCLALIRAFPAAPVGGAHRGARPRRGFVELVEGPTSSRDALAYARVLRDLGRGIEAEELVRAVLTAELGLSTPLGAQVREERPQGHQHPSGTWILA